MAYIEFPETSAREAKLASEKPLTIPIPAIANMQKRNPNLPRANARYCHAEMKASAWSIAIFPNPDAVELAVRPNMILCVVYQCHARQTRYNGAEALLLALFHLEQENQNSVDGWTLKNDIEF